MMNNLTNYLKVMNNLTNYSKMMNDLTNYSKMMNNSKMMNDLTKYLKVMNDGLKMTNNSKRCASLPNALLSWKGAGGEERGPAPRCSHVRAFLSMPPLQQLLPPLLIQQPPLPLLSSALHI